MLPERTFIRIVIWPSLEPSSFYQQIIQAGITQEDSLGYSGKAVQDTVSQIKSRFP